MASNNQGNSWNFAALIVALLSFCWLVGGAYWYNCKIKGVCSAPNIVSTSPDIINTPPKNVSTSSEPMEVDKVSDESLYEIEVIESETQSPIEPEIVELIDSKDEMELTILEPTEPSDNSILVELNQPEESESLEPVQISPVENDEIMVEETDLEIDLEKDDDDKLEIVEKEQKIVQDQSIEIEPTKTTSSKRTNELLWTVYFVFGGAIEKHHQNFNNQLNEILEVLKNTSKDILITGHTDNIGSESINIKISIDRANKISQLLQENGINKSRITIAPMDYKYPLLNNKTREGRSFNRRAEIYLKH